MVTVSHERNLKIERGIIMRYGLIGEKLGHSWSKIIHEQLADYTYDLIPLAKDEFIPFMEAREFSAINVTIPYKEAVIPYLDVIDDNALSMKAVNTIVHKDGKLYGYNTDYLGFIYTLEQNHIDVTGKKCIVLGNGGANKAVVAALHTCNAGNIIVVNRSLTENVISYDECYEKHTDADVIINTTPAGMYPLYLDQKPLELTRFPHCKAVIDIVYNPLQTLLLKEAAQLGMHAVNGLEMLVAQAKYAVEYFLDVTLEESIIASITNSLTDQMQEK